MKVIRIDQQVWQLLQNKAVPLEDSPNTVLRRLLGLGEVKNNYNSLDNKQSDLKSRRKRKRKSRLTRGSGRTDQSFFKIPILKTLLEIGGRAESKEVISRLEKLFKSQLPQVDYEKVSSGQTRWKNTAQWCKYNLLCDGLLLKNSPRGFWELSDLGRKYVEEVARKAEK